MEKLIEDIENCKKDYRNGYKINSDRFLVLILRAVIIILRKVDSIDKRIH